MNLLSMFRKKEHLPEKVAQLAFNRRSRVHSLHYVRQEWHKYESRSGLYRYLRDRVPIISSAIWNWVRLCNTPGSCQLIGRDRRRRQAEKVLEALFDRISTVVGLKRTGLGSLLELFFQEVFTNGNFSGRIIPLASGTGIDYFEVLDTSKIEWEKKGRWIPYIKRDDRKISLDNGLFFHYGLGADRDHPGGISFLASIEFVTEIEQRMVEDMARSGHNAGNPHLHVKITPPERFDNENDAKYIKRAEKYFDDAVVKFQQLDPDENIFTWSDIEVAIIGGGGTMPYSWRINREQVIEDVITGMKLFPWVVGRSHGTTKNWVQAQFNLLMQVVDSIQEEGKALAEWILNTELRLRGIPVKASYIFSPNQDPYQLEREKAAALRFETVDKKVRRGYISKDEGAKELGFDEAYRQDVREEK
ncbi:hypothetical protein AMJ80_04920 [bacterium SM23_31]|nr:MAG: hypothetical protein AMJ80_04920 [bacterium SM23_31]